MKAENEPKKAGACRHDHPVRSQWKICLLVAPSRRAGISHSDPSYSGVTSHTHARAHARTHKRTHVAWLEKNVLEIYVTADSNLQKALLLTNVALWWPRRFNCFLMLHTFRSDPPTPPSFFNLNFMPKSPKVEHML